MNHSAHKLHHRETRESSTRSQEDQHIKEKKTSTDNPEELEYASPTSAPPKLYSGSLFLYSNDPFGCFTNESQGIHEDKQYNRFFNTSKHSKEDGHRHTSHSQGDLDSLDEKHNDDYAHPIHETKSDLDASDMLSRQNSSLADARASPDRLDAATNKAIIDIFEDSYTVTDTKQDNSKNKSHNNNAAGKYRHEREARGYVSPPNQKENRQFGHPAMMVPPMGYVQGPYMAMQNQPYVNMVPQGFAFPLDDGGYRRVNQYSGGNFYNNNNYDGYNNERTTNNFNNNNKNVGYNQKNKKDELPKKEFTNSNRKESHQQSNKKEKREGDIRKQNSETNSLGGDFTVKSTSLDSEDVESLVQNASKLAKDQTGCRMLQKEIEKEDPATMGQIFTNIIKDFGQLMVDPFGNYLCQKISEMCNKEQMKQVIQVVSDELSEICYNPHGTRVVQKLIEVVQDQELIEMLVESLSRNVVGLVKDNNGNHVVQKCLTSMSEQNKQFIYDSIVENCVDIATHKHGCCVIQRCLDHASRKQKADLARVVAENALELVKDQYGNYVVQYVFELKDTDPKTKQRIADELTRDIVELSKQKFSSNVVEKILQSGIESFRDRFMELLTEDDTLVEVVCDKFANYVLQRFLANANEEERSSILQTVGNNADSINSDAFGHKIYAKLSKTYSGLGDSDCPSPLVSEGSYGNNNRQSHGKNESNRWNNNNNENYKQAPRKQQQQYYNRNNGDKKNNFNEVSKGRRFNNTNNNNGNNQQNNMGKGTYMNQVPGPMMYPHMRNDGMPGQNFGPTLVQQGFFMPQPPMYNHYYNYPQQGMYYQ